MIKGIIIGASIIGIIGVGTTIYLLKNKKRKSNKEIGILVNEKTGEWIYI